MEKENNISYAATISYNMFDVDLENYIPIKIDFTIYLEDYFGERIRKIGGATVYDLNDTWNEECLISQADKISGDFLDTTEKLIQTKIFKTEEYNRFFYLDKLFIKKDYRNKGAGQFLLTFIREYLSYLSPDDFGMIYFSIEPYEIDRDNETEYKKYKTRLKKFYKKAGFNIEKFKDNSFIGTCVL